ncbi:MAG: metal-sulfur cluster assembly factor [Vulcanimicrobiaceae bacterium]
MNDSLLAQIDSALHTVIDPELGIDIVSLGLIYGVTVKDSAVEILMTLTTPGCPMHATISAEVEETLRRLAWVKDVTVRVTYMPPWTPDMLTLEARVLLGR